MPSFDVVSKVDPQTVENAINVARKEIMNRYDFHGTNTEIEFNKKDLTIHITTANDMLIKTAVDIIIMRGSKQGIDPRAYDLSKEHYASGAMVKKDIRLKNGLDAEAIKKIMKAIKDTGLKVQPQKMDNIIRVSGKKIDDLQKVISVLRAGDFGYPLQFENMKS
ncbi:MAG: YajQ family cyclic di-GMP-binding protein [Chitinophagales bacterium]|nr:YajQ family cyclic di-GMP-binding protein [Chitinophagales bacterium]MDW8418439.1 YajQ family cyclic di-GMP-binding protein [Chitinophagales bacterium]